ncbi:putative deoxyhypusine synthase [ANME-1 cluster archaeon GoMg1]|nr:putative deoxyhypusine synthase [ANME-1 cluster archaeon GoMg1]
MQLKEVKGIRIGKCEVSTHDSENTVRACMSVDDLVSAFGGCAFGAGRLAIAADIYEEMQTDETTKFIGIAGALVPAGMRNVIAEMVREREVDVVVATGANLVHDIIEALGNHHYKIDVEDGSGLAAGAETNAGMVPETETKTETETPTPIDDIWLREQGLERIYDVIVHEEAFARLEAFLRTVFDKLDCENHEGGYSIRELTKAIGENLADRDSILRAAVDSDVPVFCPAIADSMIGLHAWIYKQTCPLKVDAFSDMKELVDIFCDAKRTGAIILGGGVPKNFIFQTALIAPPGEQGQEGFDYAIQITTDTPENGGLSGATLEEAKSWGKVGAKAKAVTVYCDATIALPVIVAAVRERIARRAALGREDD